MVLATDLVLLSPHRDDAAFSCGLLLAAAVPALRVRIVNVFSRSGYAPFAETAERAGVDRVTALRRREDAAFLLELQRLRVAGASTQPGQGGVTLVDLGLLDAPWRLRLRTEEVLEEPLTAAAYEREVRLLAGLLGPLLGGTRCVLLPLALGEGSRPGHIDHRIVRDAGRRALEALGEAPDRTEDGVASAGKLAFYEDLPYAARSEPAVRAARVAAVEASCAETLAPLRIANAAGGDRKQGFAALYPSQVDAATCRQMADYCRQAGGEQVYAASAARALLTSLAGETAARPGTGV